MFYDEGKQSVHNFPIVNTHNTRDNVWNYELLLEEEKQLNNYDSLGRNSRDLSIKRQRGYQLQQNGYYVFLFFFRFAHLP